MDQAEETSDVNADVLPQESSSSVSTPTAVMTSNSELLLREWNNAPATIPEDSTTDVSNTMMLFPPVAPAVVLNETSEGSSSSNAARVYSYPVATFVSNFVRSSVNELRDHVNNHIYAATAVPTTEHDDDEHLHPNSMRAVSEPVPIRPLPESQGVLEHHDHQDHADEELVLIDGDLIAIPAMHQAYHDDEDDDDHHHHHRHRHGFGSRIRSIGGGRGHHHTHSSISHIASETDSTSSADPILRRENSWHHPRPSYTQSMSNMAEAAAGCRSDRTRMQRGYRKVKKWMKKKHLLPKRGLWHKSPPASQSNLDPQAVESTATLPSTTSLEEDANLPNWDEPATMPASTAAAYPQPTPSEMPLQEEVETTKPPARRTSQLGQRGASARSNAQTGLDNDWGDSSTLPSMHPSLAATIPSTAAASLPASSALDVSLDASDVDHSSMAYQSPYVDSTATASLLTVSDRETPSLYRTESIAAEYVGSEDQLLQAGVMPDYILSAEAYIEDRLDDYDKYDKKEGYGMRSMVPRDADFKVDKQEAPCVDVMLRRAGALARDMETDLAESTTCLAEPHTFLGQPKGKSSGESVPLTMATIRDKLVHNDVLKLVMVADSWVDKSSLARALRESNKKPRKRSTLGVDVHSWTPPNADKVKFTIWDVQGASADSSPYDANFGAHPGTQSLFFSDRALYLLVWDLAVSNPKTHRRPRATETNGYDSDSECSDILEQDEQDDNEYLREEANRLADRALQTDIEERVLSWVNCIARRGTHSAILPVALVPQGMSPEETKRRCDALQTLLMQHTERMEHAPKVLSGAETVLCVSLETNMGMDLLRETILAIATDASHSVFDHVGTPVPVGTAMVLETARRLKQEHKLVLVDHLMVELMTLKGETEMILTEEQVLDALHFLGNIGELIYFGGIDEVLSHYVILSRKWLVSALSCVLRNDLKRELMESRRFMNMQCIYSDQQFPENHVTQTFSANTSNCPLLSSNDTQMLWQSMSFMREAADKTSMEQENPATASTMFGFLEHLLVHTGVFLPLDIDRFAVPDMVYFVPSLLAQANSSDVWTYKSSDSWMTTLSHSWLFRDGVPSGLMEHVTVALLRDLYEFSHVVGPSTNSHPPRSQTFPLAQNSFSSFLDTHDGEAIGHIKIHQMMVWKNSLLIKIGCVFPEGNELRESFVEIFVAIADPSSPHCVASDAMRSNMQRLIVSGKGQVGHHGRKLWRGGYSLVLDSIKASVTDCTNVDRQVVCPECLAHAHPSAASTWSWDSVRAAAETGSTVVRCMRGHRVDSNLICGTIKAPLPKTDGLHHPTEAPKKPVKDLLSAVVLVGLYDPSTGAIKNVGSGFLADKRQGLVVTAGHILFDMEEGRNFGTPYFGLKNAKVVVGVIPEGARNENNAVYRYFAEIMADDIHSMDACVLRITSRLEKDVDNETSIGQQPETLINLQEEQLPVLKMTKRFELEETVRILGFNQAGEGWLEQGKHVNRTADFARGYICKLFKLADDNSESESDDSSSSGGCFSPREEIVIMCPTIPGHSGGPCVNDEGRVIGILSRADPVDRQRCYLVPSSELKTLVNKAKKSTSRSTLKQL
eukprot:Nitzschia sp. Nitz4//scaffold259_size27336//21972//26726//NITZ4_008195-RA/size27336-processed-gene-0.0-mRNA-1//1//CDS//3329544516//2763//frame0